MIVGRALHFLSFALRHHRGTFRVFNTGYLFAQSARQSFRRWQSRQTCPSDSESILPVRAVTRGPLQHFFGYYDKCPWDQSGHRLLALEAPRIWRTPRPGDEVTVGWIEPQNGQEFHPIAKSKAWNWQQGCMLQWLGTPAGEKVFYNDFRADKYVGVIRSANGNSEEQVLERPLYAPVPDGRSGVSVDFERLHRCMPGYGYSARVRHIDARLLPDDDGIWGVDTATGKSTLLVSLSQLGKLAPRPCMSGAEHYINHLQFSPGGQSLAFLHRWHIDGSYYSRLYTMRADGSELRCVADSDLVSHYNWLDDQHILAWARQPGLGDHFYLYDISKTSSCPAILGESLLTEDGHPSYSPDKQFLLVDTYPDEEQRQHLFVFNLNLRTKVELGCFRQPLRFNDDIRCDLHPRWNRDGTMICFDSTHDGLRQIYMLDVEPWLRRQESE